VFARQERCVGCSVEADSPGFSASVALLHVCGPFMSCIARGEPAGCLTGDAAPAPGKGAFSVACGGNRRIQAQCCGLHVLVCGWHAPGRHPGWYPVCPCKIVAEICMCLRRLAITSWPTLICTRAGIHSGRTVIAMRAHGNKHAKLSIPVLPKATVGRGGGVRAQGWGRNRQRGRRRGQTNPQGTPCGSFPVGLFRACRVVLPFWRSGELP
jgi:hypothetical protein